MPFNPDNSAVKMTPELERTLANCASSYEIAAAIHAAEVQQGLRIPDAIDPTVLLEVDQPQPQRFAKVVILNGTKHILEAQSESGLVDAELALFRRVEQQRTQNTDQSQQSHGAAPARDPNTGKFINAQMLPRRDSQEADRPTPEEQQQIAAQVEWDLKFKRGEISAKEYLEKSGAFDQMLAERGIDTKAQQEENQAIEREVSNFLENSDWPGGEENQQTMGEILLENNLQPTAENMRQAYEFMKANSLVKDNPEIEKAKDLQSKINSAGSVEEIRAALNSAGHQDPHGLHGIWGGR